MSMASIILSSVCAISIVFLSISVYFNVRHGLIILRVQDALENSLDILDERYKSMSAVLEKPIFFDSLEVRQVISDIEKSRDSILYVANALTASTSKQGEVSDDKENS